MCRVPAASPFRTFSLARHMHGRTGDLSAHRPRRLSRWVKGPDALAVAILSNTPRARTTLAEVPLPDIFFYILRCKTLNKERIMGVAGPDSALNINVGAGRYPLQGFVNLDNSIFLRALPFWFFRDFSGCVAEA